MFPPHYSPEDDCVLRRLLDAEPERTAVSWPTGFEGGIAHRLDTWTSGALAVAEEPEELEALRAAFASRRLTKTYWFWASREVAWHQHSCDRPMAHDRRRRSRMVVQRSPSTPHRGRWMRAHTSFRRIEGRLWEAQMSTGVMHQIRLHAAFVGLAIVGDRHYGGGTTPEGWGEGFFLHHLGFSDSMSPHRFTTSPVELPEWTDAARAAGMS